LRNLTDIEDEKTMILKEIFQGGAKIVLSPSTINTLIQSFATQGKFHQNVKLH